MYQKLATLYNFSVLVNGDGIFTKVINISDNNEITFFSADKRGLSADMLKERHLEFMHSITDSQAAQYFPENKTKTPVLTTVTAPDIANVKNIRYIDGVHYIGKNNKLVQVTRDLFLLELVKRFGKKPTEQWSTENP